MLIQSANITAPISVLNTNQNKRKASKITTTQRTPTASEYRESEIRQRCGCRISSSYAENCGAPISRSHIEDVHSVDPTGAENCARYETCMHNLHRTPPALAYPLQSKPSANQHNVDVTIRTLATSEDGDSKIRQRCCTKPTSRYAESCSAPTSRSRVEDVDNIRGATGEEGETDIRQRCGCKTNSSLAENCSAPNSRSRVQDVHSV
jgi:hypothetical protein